MAEIDQEFYQVSYKVLKEEGVPEHLADAASRIVASDDISSENLGRTPIDIEICRQVAVIVTQNEKQPST